MITYLKCEIQLRLILMLEDRRSGSCIRDRQLCEFRRNAMRSHQDNLDKTFLICEGAKCMIGILYDIDCKSALLAEFLQQLAPCSSKLIEAVIAFRTNEADANTSIDHACQGTAEFLVEGRRFFFVLSQCLFNTEPESSHELLVIGSPCEQSLPTSEIKNGKTAIVEERTSLSGIRVLPSIAFVHRRKVN